MLYQYCNNQSSIKTTMFNEKTRICGELKVNYRCLEAYEDRMRLNLMYQIFSWNELYVHIIFTCKKKHCRGIQIFNFLFINYYMIDRWYICSNVYKKMYIFMRFKIRNDLSIINVNYTLEYMTISKFEKIATMTMEIRD